MSKIGKILLALAATALAMTALASAAMANTGVVRMVETGEELPENTVFHYVGFARFSGAGSSFECDVTAETKANNGTTGQVTAFTVPDTTKCAGTGVFEGCVLTAHESTNLPWHVTTTATDFDVTGEIKIDNKFKECPEVAGLGQVEAVNLSFDKITATPLATGERVVTGTGGGLGETAEPGAPIAGIELEEVGEVHQAVVVFSIAGPVPIEVAVDGALELTAPDYDTWFIEQLG